MILETWDRILTNRRRTVIAAFTLITTVLALGFAWLALIIAPILANSLDKHLPSELASIVALSVIVTIPMLLINAGDISKAILRRTTTSPDPGEVQACLDRAYAAGQVGVIAAHSGARETFGIRVSLRPYPLAWCADIDVSTGASGPAHAEIERLVRGALAASFTDRQLARLALDRKHEPFRPEEPPLSNHARLAVAARRAERQTG